MMTSPFDNAPTGRMSADSRGLGQATCVRSDAVVSESAVDRRVAIAQSSALSVRRSRAVPVGPVCAVATLIIFLRKAI
jgi:hypothetical protein